MKPTTAAEKLARERAYRARRWAAERAGTYGGPTYAQLNAIRAALSTGDAEAAAALLGITAGTLRAHLSAAYRRLNVTTLAQAVAKLDDDNPTWRERRVDWLADFRRKTA